MVEWSMTGVCVERASCKSIQQTEKCRKRFGAVRVRHTQIFISINLSVQGMGLWAWVLGTKDKRSLAMMARAKFKAEVTFLEC